MPRRSGRRSLRRRLILVLMLTLVSLPAMAGQQPRVKPGKQSSFLSLWHAVVRWVVPSGWGAKLGPEMDPNGVTATVPGGGTGDSARNGELGPDMDPNG
jgi:hypothetical protein